MAGAAGVRRRARSRVSTAARGRLAWNRDEIITKVVIPLPAANELVKLYKISKRKEIDTSTFRAAIRIDAHDGLIRSAAVAYSGRCCRGRRGCAQTESFLVGQTFSESTFRQAGKRARAEVEPISDVRGSRLYRLQLAERILVKFYQETSGAARQEAALGE